MPGRSEPLACAILRQPERVRRAIYRYQLSQARRMEPGQRQVSYRIWLDGVRRLCRLARRDPGGDITL